MGEIVSSVLGPLLEKLATESYRNIVAAWGLENDVNSLQKSVKIIDDYLMDAENKQAGNDSITKWLLQLRDVLLDANVVVDQMEYEALRNQVVGTRGTITRKVCHFCSCSNPLAFRVKMARKVRGLKERIHKIAFDILGMRLSQVSRSDMPLITSTVPWKESQSYVEPYLVIGRDEDREVIMRHLMAPQTHDYEIGVIPIVGIGGIGKTTLAQYVYSDKRVIGHFELQMWVWVSHDFDVKKLAIKILKAVDRSDGNLENLALDVLISLVHEKLQEKRFLLVLDDVWNSNRMLWLEVKNFLLSGYKIKTGSKIIVTTRNETVALIMRNVPQHNLRELPDDECLKLFVQCAFQIGEEKQYPKLIEIGKQIIKKCKGVPLAVVTLGCLLFSKHRYDEWETIRDSEIWKIDKSNDGILPALRLSYNDLPFHLKLCFSYCSIFPKNYEYSSIKLIPFWMAHGLLQSTNENMEPEELGELYIQELMSRFFFHNVVELAIPGFCMFKMHDLVHDLAMHTMQDKEPIYFGSTNMHVKENTRHLSFSNGEGVPTFGPQLRNAQTVGFWHAPQKAGAITEPFVKWICNHFKYLRVLHLGNSNLRFLPNCFGTMKHLRFLSLAHCSKLEKLPSSISNLHSLQSLNLGECISLEGLPKHTNYLISLRFLLITSAAMNLSTIKIGYITSLQDLFLWNCTNLVSLPRDLLYLHSLRRLVIWECQKLVNFQDDEKEEMEKELSLQHFLIFESPKLAALPNWLQKSAKTLRDMSLVKCSSLSEIPEWIGKLKSLQSLHIRSCPKLSSLPDGIYGLYALRHLDIYDCPQLVNAYRKGGPIWQKIAHFPYVKVSDMTLLGSSFKGNLYAEPKLSTRLKWYIGHVWPETAHGIPEVTLDTTLFW